MPELTVLLGFALLLAIGVIFSLRADVAEMRASRDTWRTVATSLKTERDVARSLAGMHIPSQLSPSLGTEAPSGKGNDEEHDGA